MKESRIYDFDRKHVENAEKNETSSIIAFPLYVLNQELNITGDLDEQYVNLYSALKEIPRAETQQEFSERHAETRRDRNKLEREKAKKQRKKSLMPPKIKRSELYTFVKGFIAACISQGHVLEQMLEILMCRNFEILEHVEIFVLETYTGKSVQEDIRLTGQLENLDRLAVLLM